MHMATNTVSAIDYQSFAWKRVIHHQKLACCFYIECIAMLYCTKPVSIFSLYIFPL